MIISEHSKDSREVKKRLTEDRFADEILMRLEQLESLIPNQMMTLLRMTFNLTSHFGGHTLVRERPSIRGSL